MVSFIMQYMILLFLILTSCKSSQNNTDISDQSLSKMADAALQNNDLQNAEALYQKILQNDPKNLDALYKMGVIQKYSENIVQALKIFDMCLTEDPNFIKAHLEKAYLYAQQKKYDKAFESYDSVLKIDPKTLTALNGKAMIFDILGHHDQAQNLYNQILQINPSYSYAMNNLGLSYLFQGKWNAAIQLFENLNQSTSTPKYRQNLALAYGLSGNFEKFKALSTQDLPPEIIENNLKFIQHLQTLYTQQGLLKNTDISLFPILKDLPTETVLGKEKFTSSDIYQITESKEGVAPPSAPLEQNTDDQDTDTSAVLVSKDNPAKTLTTELKQDVQGPETSSTTLTALTPTVLPQEPQESKNSMNLTKLSPSSLQNSSQPLMPDPSLSKAIAKQDTIRLTPAA